MRSSLAVALLLASLIPARAFADDTTSRGAYDESGPSLAARGDRSAPWQHFALSTNVLAPIWNEYGLALHAMPSRFVGGQLEFAYRRGDDSGFVGRLAVDLRPMGRSFDGLSVMFGAAYEGRSERRIGVFADAGYSMTWRGILVGASIGVELQLNEQIHVFRPRGAIRAGWAF